MAVNDAVKPTPETSETPTSLVGLLRAGWSFVALAIVVTVVAVVGSTGSEVTQLTITNMLVNLILVVGLYLFVGNCGVISFGQISFMAIGAYTSAIFTVPEPTKGVLLPDLPGFVPDVTLGFVPSILVAALVAAVLAALVSIPIMRLSGLAAGISTLSLLLIVQVVISNWDDLTRGRRTMLGVPADTKVGNALVAALVIMLVAFLYQQSASGLRLRTSREDEPASRSIGVRVARERRVAFVLSAACCAVAGALYAHMLGAFEPGAFYFKITFLTIAMLVVGGINSLAGAVVGTLVVTAIYELVGHVEDGFDIGSLHIATKPGLREVVLAAVMLLILIFRPDGITKGREIQWPFTRPERPPPRGAAE